MLDRDRSEDRQGAAGQWAAQRAVGTNPPRDARERPESSSVPPDEALEPADDAGFLLHVQHACLGVDE